MYLEMRPQMFIGWNTMQNLKQEFSELLSKKGNHNITNID